MNTLQLICALDSDPMMREYRREVYALDEFKQARLEIKGIYICNEEPSMKEGSHWILIFIQPEKTYFVDSFGYDPDYYGLENKLKVLKTPILTFSKVLQNPFS
uniref:Uncharacterized protein n=1 Tax=Clytia hemisphaerica TaxID=252671 RepID=A0A7M5XHV3_9CNID